MNILIPIWEFIMTNAMYIQNYVDFLLDHYFEEVIDEEI